MDAVGGPWWAYLLVAAVGAFGGIAGALMTRRRDKATNEQSMIDQLQEETKSLRADLNDLSREVRDLRVREIAWITHTSTLTQIVGMAGQAIPPLPEELRARISHSRETP
jgi:uncharacterized protein YlxW (UPF0749 family)